MPTNKRRIAVNLSDKEFSGFAELAERHEVSLAWLGRQAILAFVERYRTGQQLDLPLRIRAQGGVSLATVGKQAGGRAS